MERLRLGGDGGGDDVGYAARAPIRSTPGNFLVGLPGELSDQGLEWTWWAVLQRVNEIFHKLLDMYYSSYLWFPSTSARLDCKL